MPVRPTAEPQEDKPAEPITEEDIDRRIEKALRDHGMLPKKRRAPKKKGPKPEAPVEDGETPGGPSSPD